MIRALTYLAAALAALIGLLAMAPLLAMLRRCSPPPAQPITTVDDDPGSDVDA